MVKSDLESICSIFVTRVWHTFVGYILRNFSLFWTYAEKIEGPGCLHHFSVKTSHKSKSGVTSQANEGQSRRQKWLLMGVKKKL